MVNLVLNQDDVQWNAAYAAIKSDPDNLDYWELLIENTERVQAKASQEIAQYVKNKQASFEKQPQQKPYNSNNIPACVQLYNTIKTTTREVYDKFLERFPLLFAYWAKYVALEVDLSKEQRLINKTLGFKTNIQKSPSGGENVDGWNTLLNVPSDALTIHERAVAAFPMSTDLWVAYTAFLVQGLSQRHPVGNTEEYQQTKKSAKPVDKKTLDAEIAHIQSVFERAASEIGKDFMSHVFWDEYLAFEETYGKEQQQPDEKPKKSATPTAKIPKHKKRILSLLARIVRLPLHQYARYYEQFRDNFLALVQPIYPDLEGSTVDQEVASLVLQDFEIAYLKLQNAKDSNETSQPKKRGRKPSASKTDSAITPQAIVDYFTNVIFARSQQGTTDRWTYESQITRSYFHVVALEQDQLENWQAYLTWGETEYTRISNLFTKKQNGESLEDQEEQWKVCITQEVVEEALEQIRVLYERALVPGALYDSIWLRYVRWLYAQAKARDDDKAVYGKLLEDTRNVYRRASTIFVPVSRPFIRFQYSLFEESLGEIVRARDVLQALQEEAYEGITLAGALAEEAIGREKTEKNKKKEGASSNKHDRSRPWKDASLRRVLKDIDFTEPFFYRVELERRVGGVSGALRYVSFLLGGDQSIEKDTELRDLVAKDDGAALLPLSKPAAEFPKIYSFLVATKALLIAELYKQVPKTASLEEKLGFFSKSVFLARKYFESHILAATETNSNGLTTLGTLSTQSHFWVSFFEFELGVAKKIGRLSGASLMVFEAQAGSMKKESSKRKLEEDFDEYQSVVRYVRAYLDPLVDLLLTKVGLPPTTITDLVRTYVDDLLLGVIGKRRAEIAAGEVGDASSVIARIVKKAKISSAVSATEAPANRLTGATGTYRQWPATRALELETELTGPLIVRPRLLAKLADDGNAETTLKRLRTREQEVFVR